MFCFGFADSHVSDTFVSTHQRFFTRFFTCTTLDMRTATSSLKTF
jgi:hypothetical protein